MKLSETNIQFLSGVGEKKALIFKTELNVISYEDMINYLPYKYIDRSLITPIKNIRAEMQNVQFVAKITNLQITGNGRTKRMKATAYDNSGKIELVWFKGIKYIPSQINPDTIYLLFGKPNLFGGKMNIVHPELDVYENVKDRLVGFQPIYSTTEKMKKSIITSRNISNIIYNIFNNIHGQLLETLPKRMLDEKKLINRHQAIYNAHFPVSTDILKQAIYRLKFEELFYIQLYIRKEKAKRKTIYKGHPFTNVGDLFNNFYASLPFELTNAQKRVIKEIRQDCRQEKQMNRLLQGDVGSGKTMVALISMLIANDNGFQACIMAPTEILATQHYNTIVEMLKDIPVVVRLLTGSTTKKSRSEIHEKLVDGSLNILIGTHALIEDNVVFNNLGIVIIDEQHRFGVEQRAKLWRKNAIPPHILIMTATPIPRTLAMTVYGDLDVSIIDELPPGRKPIDTIHTFEKNRIKVFEFIENEIKKGKQAYIVYPLIFESEKQDMRNLEIGHKQVNDYFSPKGYKVGMVHGKMRPSEKDEEINKFVRKDTHILLATTVIEVGVNIPNASIMLIENAERFGLSQLHQLRGRVGRGAAQSYCILMTGYKLSNDSRARLKIMTETNDGFEIAEADLKLRGQGDIDGTRQSGIAFDLKIANIAKDGLILKDADETAKKIIDNDPELKNEENFIISETLKKLFKNNFMWKSIG